MDATAEAAALMATIDGPKWTSGAVPPEVAPLLKSLADLAAERGKGLPFDRLQEVVRQKTGLEKGRTILRRWVIEAGGLPWFKA